MKKILLLLFYLFTLLPLHAQEFGMRWLYCAQAEETQQVWFKRSFHMNEPAASAVLSIASEGRYIIYVNGFIVTPELFIANPRGAIGIRDYDIAHLLTEGTNTIAVWYSPVGYTRRQLYTTLLGQWQSGGRLYLAGDEGWVCRPANARTLPDGNEEISGPDYIAEWKDYDWKEDSNLFSVWQQALIATELEPALITFCRHEPAGFRMQRVLKRAKVSQRGRTVTYDFGEQVEGWVRVTMRGMKKGEVVEVNGLRYVCRGGSDDQACRRFTTSTAGIARITLPAGRSRSNITRVEAIAISIYKTPILKK